MKGVRVHHVSVNTQGVPVDEVASFYRDLLGLPDISRPVIPGVEGHWHAAGQVQLHLVGSPALGSAIDPTGNHFCVEVEDLDAAVVELEEKRIPFLRAVQDPGVVQIWINDPAGNTIELQQARP